MRMRMGVVMILSALASVGLVMGGDGKKDEDKLQGTWKAEKDGKKGVMKFEGNKFAFTFNFEEKAETYKGTFKLNAAANPKQVDMTPTEGPKEGYRNKTALGIYELDGDTFKWCSNEPGKDERPREFSDKYLQLEFKRAKKK